MDLDPLENLPTGFSESNDEGHLFLSKIVGAYLIKGLIEYVNDTYIFINPCVDYHDNKHL